MASSPIILLPQLAKARGVRRTGQCGPDVPVGVQGRTERQGASGVGPARLTCSLSRPHARHSRCPLPLLHFSSSEALAARGGGTVQGRNGRRGEASVGEGPPTFPTREANKTLSNQPCLRTGLWPETPTLPPTPRGPPQGWCLALRECLGCHGRLKAPLCPRETQGPGRGEKSVGADGPQGRGGAGGLLGRGLLHAHLSLHAHGHQGWRKQGRAPSST